MKIILTFFTASILLTQSSFAIFGITDCDVYPEIVNEAVCSIITEPSDRMLYLSSDKTTKEQRIADYQKKITEAIVNKATISSCSESGYVCFEWFEKDVEKEFSITLFNQTITLSRANSVVMRLEHAIAIEKGINEIIAKLMIPAESGISLPFN